MSPWESKFHWEARNTIFLWIAFPRDLAVELPFTLTHPKPAPTPSPSRQFDPQTLDDQPTADVPLDHNLIQLDAKFVFCDMEREKNIYSMFCSFDTAGHDDDFIFEEFARIRLKGHEGGLDDTEA